MLPLRFRIIRPYLASLIHCNFRRPPVGEVMHWLFQPAKEKRAARFILRTENVGEFIAVYFKDRPATPFYFPREASWEGLCQTVDECFNSKNWHEYLANGLTLGPDDIVLDCGAAEGLFTFMVAPRVKKVYAIEPIPMWLASLKKNFSGVPNVELVEVAVGHRGYEAKMTDSGLSSGFDRAGTLTIRVETIDALFFTKGLPVSLIKADVEGFEFQALLGAEQTIRANRPRLSLTVYHTTNHLIEIQTYLKQIHGDYQFRTRGIAENGNPVLLQVF